jgi:hypothetical protein
MRRRAVAEASQVCRQVCPTRWVQGRRRMGVQVGVFVFASVSVSMVGVAGVGWKSPRQIMQRSLSFAVGVMAVSKTGFCFGRKMRSMRLRRGMLVMR